jgi:hypothetical protein
MLLNVSSPVMRRMSLAVATLVALASMLIVSGDADAKQGKQTAIPVSGDLSDGGTFTGKIVDPVISGDDSTGTFSLSGTLEGQAKTADGKVQKIDQDFENVSVEPVTDASNTADVGAQSCPILHLNIGAINLDLLGLVVNLSPITLDVTAVPGAGNLLGNLLCAVTGLLDNGGANLTSIIANLLNSLLAGLFGHLLR